MGGYFVSRRDEVMTLLARSPDGLTDAELARLTRASHQAINQLCRQLATEHRIRRDDLSRPIMNFAVGSAGSPPTVVGRALISHQEEWFWEGNVQALVVRYLAVLGAVVHSVADTASKARGTDVVATVAGRRLHVEVKGWPSTMYADPRRAGEVKRTQPTVQAKHWYAEAVLSALRLRGRYAEDRVIVALPAFDRYRRLAEETAPTLGLVRIEVWLVDESGEVRCAY
jgi:hypothetical protein